MPLLSVAALQHGYRRTPWSRRVSLRGVDLEVRAGECWGLVGPNGSGKSTLLRIVAGLALPTAGRVTLFGQPAGSRAVRGRVGYAPEALRWPPALRVIEVLHELSALDGLRGAVARVRAAAAVTGLAELLDRPLGSLSLGQSQRVVLASALLGEPELLLLDEPFSGLDSLVLHDVRSHLALRLAEGAACLLASHRVDDLRGLATHLLVLREGRVVAAGPAAEQLAGAHDRDGLLSLLGGPA